jgi:hypothetical protein
MNSCLKFLLFTLCLILGGVASVFITIAVVTDFTGSFFDWLKLFGCGIVFNNGYKALLELVDFLRYVIWDQD